MKAISGFLFIAAMMVFSMQAVAQTPAPASAGLPGKWHFVLDTPGGDRDVDAEFKLADDQVTGTWGPSTVAGTFKESKLVLDFPFNSDEAGSGQMKINGTVDGDAITGTWVFSDYNGTFKAARAKGAGPDAKAPDSK